MRPKVDEYIINFESSFAAGSDGELNFTGGTDVGPMMEDWKDHTPTGNNEFEINKNF